jgi:tetratricopeptide (TPR) repeat protein
MTVQEYLAAFAAARQKSDEISRSTIDLADRAVAQHPTSAELWEVRGDLIQLGAETPYELDEALRSYERAAEQKPNYGKAYESIGYFHDVHTQDFAAAESAFRQAIECGVGTESYIGLARVLAQRGARPEEINAVLSAAPDKRSEALAEFRDELARGIWS